MKKEQNFQHMKINTKNIFSDPLYQRGIDTARVRRIVKDFDENLVNACKVSFRDGRYWVFDGQHTIAALKARNGGKDLMVDCKVFFGLTRLDEKELFVKQNGYSRSVDTLQKLRANYNFGDPDATELVRLIELAGFRVSFDKSTGPWKIVAVNAAEKAHELLGSVGFVDMLTIIGEAWSGHKDSTRAEIIGGMSLFYDTYQGVFDRKSFVSRLSAVSPIEIIREGKTSRTGGKTPFARVLLGVYNNRRKNKLEDKL